MLNYIIGIALLVILLELAYFDSIFWKIYALTDNLLLLTGKLLNS